MQTGLRELRAAAYRTATDCRLVVAAVRPTTISFRQTSKKITAPNLNAFGTESAREYYICLSAVHVSYGLVCVCMYIIIHTHTHTLYVLNHIHIYTCVCMYNM